MTLEEIRKEIDAIDTKIQELLLKRFKCSHSVAMSKIDSEDTTIYRADREKAVLDRLGGSVHPELRTEYLAIVKRIMESSRMYQYGLLFDSIEGIFAKTFPGTNTEKDSESIVISFIRSAAPNSLSSVLCMIGDHGFRLQDIDLHTAEYNYDNVDDLSVGSFYKVRITLNGNIHNRNTQKMLFQLSMETIEFKIENVI